MEFLVTKTSAHPNERPCVNAVRKKYKTIKEEYRLVSGMDGINLDEWKQSAYVRKSDWLSGWVSKGTNHDIVDGYAYREIHGEATGWFIEINTLEELAEFYRENGDIILTGIWQNRDILKLEIFDLPISKTMR